MVYEVWQLSIEIRSKTTLIYTLNELQHRPKSSSLLHSSLVKQLTTPDGEIATPSQLESRWRRTKVKYGIGCHNRWGKLVSLLYCQTMIHYFYHSLYVKFYIDGGGEECTLGIGGLLGIYVWMKHHTNHKM